VEELDLRPVSSMEKELDLRPVGLGLNPYQGLDKDELAKKTDRVYKNSTDYLVPFSEAEKLEFDVEEINIRQLLTKPLPRPKAGMTDWVKHFKTEEQIMNWNYGNIPDTKPRLKALAKEYMRQSKIKRNKEEELVVKEKDVLSLNAYLAYFTGGEQAAEAVMKANIFRNKPKAVDEADPTFQYLMESPNQSYVASIFDTQIGSERVEEINTLVEMEDREARDKYYKSKGIIRTKEFQEKKDGREYMLFSDSLKSLKNNEIRKAIERIQDPEASYAKSKYTEHGLSPDYDRDLLLVRNHYFALEEVRARDTTWTAKLGDMGLDMVKYMGEIALLSGIGGSGVKIASYKGLRTIGTPKLIARNAAKFSSAATMATLNPSMIANLTIERLTDKGYIGNYGEFIKTEEGQAIAKALPKSLAEGTITYFIEQKGDDIVRGLTKIGGGVIRKMPKAISSKLDDIADFMKQSKIKSFEKLPKGLRADLKVIKNWLNNLAKAGKFNGVFGENIEEYAEQIIKPALLLDDQHRNKDDAYLTRVAKSFLVNPEELLLQTVLFTMIPFGTGAIAGTASTIKWAGENIVSQAPELPEVKRRIDMENAIRNEYGVDRQQAEDIADMLEKRTNIDQIEEKIQGYEGFSDFSFDDHNNKKALVAMLVDRGLVSEDAQRLAEITTRIAKREKATVQEVVGSAEFQKDIEMSPKAKLEAEEIVAETERPIEQPSDFVATSETKPRGVSKSVEEQAVEKELVDSFESIPDYQVVSMKQQSEMVAEIIIKDYEQAKRIAMGQKAAPRGVIPEMVYIAVANRATKTGDLNTLQDLALNSGLVKIATEMGQRIRAYGELGDHSPVKAVQKIVKIRESQLKENEKATRKKLEKEAKFAEKELDKAEKAYADREIENAINNTKLPKATRTVSADIKSPKYGKNNKLVTKQEYETILADIEKENRELQIKQGKGFRKGAAYVPKPEDFVRAGKLGLYHLEAMGRNVADWSNVLIEQLGEWVKPHLEKIWKEANSALADTEIEAAVSKLADGFEKDKTFAQMSFYIDNLAKGFIRKGVIKRDDLVKAVHKELLAIDQNITIREVKDAISGYGKYRRLSKEEVDATLRDIKGQLQQLAKLEDMEKGKAPLKTGGERRVPSDEERRLIQQVNEAKKKGGYIVIDPEKQLKTALDTVKTRLKNRIADLKKQIETRQKIVKTKTEQPTDAEVIRLTTERDALQKEFDEIFGRKKLTQEQKLNMATKAMERSIAELERRIKEKDLETPKSEKLTSPQLELLRNKRDTLRAELQSLQDIANPNKALRARLLSDIEMYNEMAAEGLFEKAEKEKIEEDVDTKTLRFARDKAKRTYVAAREIYNQSGGISKEELQNIMILSQNIESAQNKLLTAKRRTAYGRPTDAEMEYGLALVAFENYNEALQHKAQKKAIPQRLLNWLVSPVDFLSDFAGTAKAIRASMDNSFIGRQGIRLFYLGITGDLQSGKIWLDTFFRSFKTIYGSLTNQPVMDLLRAEILSDPQYDLMRRAKVATAVTEEEYPIHWPSQIPIVGRLFKASEEAFTASAYYMRYRTAKMYLHIAESTGINLNDKLELESIGKLVNSLTARGYTGRQGGEPGIVNNVLWSPKMIKSHLDVLLIQPLSFNRTNFSAFAQKRAAINLVRIIMGQAAVLFIASRIWPESVEADPRSSDFGKIRIGNTRYDISGGSAALIVLAFRAISFMAKKGVIKDSSGRVKTADELGFGMTFWDLIVNFFENKMSPTASVVKDYFKGEHFGGEPVTPVSVAESLFVPLPIENLYESFEEAEMANIIVGAIAENLGVSVQTYEPKRSGGIYKYK
jgi:hypothetical protein